MYKSDLVEKLFLIFRLHLPPALLDYEHPEGGVAEGWTILFELFYLCNYNGIIFNGLILAEPAMDAMEYFVSSNSKGYFLNNLIKYDNDLLVSLNCKFFAAMQDLSLNDNCSSLDGQRSLSNLFPSNILTKNCFSKHKFMNQVWMIIIYGGNIKKVPFISESIHFDVQNSVWPVPESSWWADTLSFIGDSCQFAATAWWSRQEIKIEN